MAKKKHVGPRIRSESQIKNDIKHAFEAKVNRLGTMPETFDNFYKRVEAISKATKTPIKEIAKKQLNSVTYTSYEKRVHKNVTNILKEEGMTTRLYRAGGKTAFESTSFEQGVFTTSINGNAYQAKGRYNMGGVFVYIWTSVAGSQEQIIQMGNYLQGRRGSAI